MQGFNPEPFKQTLRFHASRYPLMEPTDAIKLVYQSVFGGGHLIADEASSLRRLAGERANTPVSACAPFEPIGLGRARMALGSDALVSLPDALLNGMFVLSSREPADDAAAFQRALGLLSDVVCNEDCFRFSSAAFSDYLASYTAAGRPMVRHSETYRRAYRPAYRVICGAYETLLPAIVLIRQAAASGKTEARVPLSGVAGANRPWAVATLARLFGGACVSVAGPQDAAELLIRF